MNNEDVIQDVIQEVNKILTIAASDNVEYRKLISKECNNYFEDVKTCNRELDKANGLRYDKSDQAGEVRHQALMKHISQCNRLLAVTSIYNKIGSTTGAFEILHAIESRLRMEDDV